MDQRSEEIKMNTCDFVLQDGELCGLPAVWTLTEEESEDVQCLCDEHMLALEKVAR